MYRDRCDNGSVWLHLPAARLGQRAAAAFVATPDRRDACAEHLSPRHLGSYLNGAGLFATAAGDLATAREYLSLSTSRDRDAGDMKNLAIGLQNLAACLGQLGETGPARDAAAEALTCAESANDREGIRDSHAYAGWLAGLVGDAAQAEQKFTAADQIEATDHPEGAHLYSINATRWAEWLARTGRAGPAQALTRRNTDISRKTGWKEDVARYDGMLGRLALAAGDTATAKEHLAAAAAGFRDGDYLTELASTLADLAEHARAIGDLEAAERHAAEAITIAARRGLVPAHCAALAARARIRASQTTAMADPDLLYQGRDAAEAAQRLATRYNLSWHELGALRAHAALDKAEGTDRGWAAKADALHARLVPPGLDPEPLATVERLVATPKAAGKRDRRHRPEPLYRMIADDLRAKIESGELAQGSQLATETKLREQYDASRNTVRDAIKWLTTLGLVETRPGQGAFVVEKVSPPFVTTLTGAGESSDYIEVAASARTSISSGLKVEIQSATPVVASALRLEEGAQVVSRHQQRFVDDTPWSLQTTFYPMSLVERGATQLILPADIPQGTVAYLAEHCGIKQAGYRDTIAVRPPDENEAWFFRLSADERISVFEIHRVGFDEDGNRLRLTVTVYPADRNRFLVLPVANISDVPRRSAMTTH
jgi:DNA-binding GntR family transcriptional regulator/tetratricopeptide (TPR) repeat protein